MKNENDPSSLNISSEFVEILNHEGNKALTTCYKLNKDNKFQSSTSAIVDDSSGGVVFKAEHILLRDIIKVYNDYAQLFDNAEEISIKAKFILIYFFEKLQGKNLNENYTLKKINQLPLSSNFNNNVKAITEVSLLKNFEKFNDVFLMPLLLKNTRSEHNIVLSSFIIRFASLMVKADDTINENEETFLKKITEKVYNPKDATESATCNEIPEHDSLELVLNELNELIGMEEIKQSIKDLANFLKVQKLREEKGLKTTTTSLHAVFMGPPGTGKTTVARLLGRIFKHLGYLEKGHLVETDRAGMVAGYVGQTAIKADEIINTASGGVLFIDEAYSLHSGSLNDFGNEAIEILLKRMEDKRKELIVVVAGYPDEMEMFIQSNPGLQSRFNRYFRFEHFEADALLRIFKLNAEKADFVLTEDAEAKLNEILDRIHEKRHKGFGNARTVRNLFEKIIERQANRIVTITPITNDLLKNLTEEDIPDILKTVKELMVF